jgi:ketosteroid isomerase-like protein
MTADEVIGFNAAVHGVVKELVHADAIRSATATGFVEEHAVRGTLPDGSRLDPSVCVVADVVDGRVTNRREYFDTGAAAGLIRALG